MVFPAKIWVLLACALAVSAIGFKSYIWFISIGYGLSIAAEGVAMLCLFKHDVLSTLLCLVLLIYGLRLGGYLAFREFRMKSYMQKIGGEIKDGKLVPMAAKIAIWVTCAALYFTEVAPVFYRLSNGAQTNVWAWIGLIVMVFGVGLESLADIQKSRAKKINPNRFVDTGLFRFVRCPNYLGEMLLWTGVMLSGIGGVRGLGQWIVCFIGYIGIIYVMFSGARRLEVRQNRTYGKDSEYQKYIRTVPIMVPFIPLYSVEKYKWLVA